MIGLLSLLHTLLTAPFKSRRRLGQSGASVWTTSSSWVRPICVGSFEPMLTIIMTSEHIGRWVRMRRFLARFCGPGSLIHMQSLADFIIITSVSRFSVHTGSDVPTVAAAVDREPFPIHGILQSSFHSVLLKLALLLSLKNGVPLPSLLTGETQWEAR